MRVITCSSQVTKYVVNKDEENNNIYTIFLEILYTIGWKNTNIHFQYLIVMKTTKLKVVQTLGCKNERCDHMFKEKQMWMHRLVKETLHVIYIRSFLHIIAFHMSHITYILFIFVIFQNFIFTKLIELFYSSFL